MNINMVLDRNILPNKQIITLVTKLLLPYLYYYFGISRSQKAFDTVDDHSLLKKLYAFGIRGHISNGC